MSTVALVIGSLALGCWASLGVAWIVRRADRRARFRRPVVVYQIERDAWTENN